MHLARDLGWWWADRDRRRRAAAADDAALPDAVRSYLARPRPDLRRDPREVRFAVLDTETTGLDAGRDRLLSIGGVAVVDGAVRADDAYECVIVGDDVGGQSATVHGMIRREVRAGVPLAEGLAGLLDWLGDAVLVAHHVAFDAAVLDRHLAEIWPAAAARRGRGRVLWNPRLDTALLARRVELGTGRHADGAGGATAESGSLGLDAVCARYDISIAARHTAAGDALATAMVLMPLLARARRRGIRSVADLVP
jgi:DNA polymerase-3 subunit epsilon